MNPPAMRRHTLAPPLRPSTNAVRPRAPTRKVFNCIVDETALVAGVKRSTRDGIRKWVAQGAIRLFVPLHTLTQLDRLKKGTERINADAREAIKWLDEVTSQLPGESSGQVQLEGVDEAFITWQEVETFLLPETLLSMDDSDSEDDDTGYAEDLESSFNQLDVSDETSMSSSHSLDDPPKSPQSAASTYSATNIALEMNGPYAVKGLASIVNTPNRTARNSAEIVPTNKSHKGAVPTYLRPLFNHILWRIHKEINPDAALESFILLTNDPAKQINAQKFGIRAKRLEQLRDAVAREDREYRNHMTVLKLENEHSKTQTVPDKLAVEQQSPMRPKSSHSNNQGGSEDEDEVLLQRAPRGPQAQTSTSQRVFDPNDFGRVKQHQGNRGGRGGFGASAGHRGRGLPSRGRGNYAPRGAYTAPNIPFRPPPTPRTDSNQPIDPDSFARPSPRANTIRGGRRRLWEPN